MDTDVVKQSLRKAMKDRRLALSPDQWREASRKAQACVMALPRWRSAREVLLYASFNNETDTSLLMADALARGVRVLMPRCRRGEDGCMDLACIACEEDLSPGMFGIPEPDPLTCPMCEDVAPDLAVIPGLAFDRSGARLGWGGGYYDRLLALEPFGKTMAVGLAFPFQLLDSLPREPWDRPVSAVCTGE